MSKRQLNIRAIFKQIKSLKIKSLLRNNLKSSFKVNSVGMKLFIVFFVSIIFFVLTVGLLSYVTSKKIIETKVSESSQQTIVQTADKVDLVLNEFDNLSIGLITDKNISDDLNIATWEESTDYEVVVALREIKDRFTAEIGKNKSIKSISMFPVNFEFEPLTTVIDLPQEGVENKSWFKETIESSGTAHWIETEKNGILEQGSPTLCISRLLRMNSKESFVVLMEIDIAELENLLASSHLGNDGYTSIITPSSQVVFAKDAELIGSKLSINESEMIKVDQKIDRLDWSIVGTYPRSELAQETHKIRNLTLIMAIAAAILAIIIGYIVGRMIANPLNHLSSLMDEGRKGNLSVRSNIKGQDEIGKLSQSFNQMMDQITDLVNQVNTSSTDVLHTAETLTVASGETAAAAREIAMATEEIALGATNLSTEAEKGADLTGTISKQINNLVNVNEKMGSYAIEVEKESVKGTSYMQELIIKTNSTEEMNRTMITRVDQLQESTHSIRNILDVLNSMTKQTNILSLNAAIEAARAGEAGKGFMVVAGEIRKLADQSAQSIRMVGDVTDTIQKEINDTVEVLTTAYPLFQEQISSVKEANTIFISVKDKMSTFTTELGTVSGSISQLEGSLMTLSESVESVSAVAEESSATSEEVASLSNQQLQIGEGLIELSSKLEKVSHQLKESLSKLTT
jgi:methyl-accepting chemotaxis protein